MTDEFLPESTHPVSPRREKKYTEDSARREVPAVSDRPTAGSSSIKPESRYTVQDYLSWSSDRRWELIHGVPYYMSPASS